ncbi:DUF882 domain-containing protein [Undibacter mobilis]|uniref:Murein endopeptidase K n=1 Tax=Undibacter mobilis TaxID=2292256 RepID=A0A371B703_9BRAD|nr:DUF882 domain-containing protein [Undibacter mobilis]RDV03379.1 DUF882 domain-containing protein [Undibacter mobilis]
MAVGRSSWIVSVSVRGVSRHKSLFNRRLGTRLGLSAALAGIVLLGAGNALLPAAAEGDSRTLSFLHLHTRETITVTFKRNGRYDDAALTKLNWFLRDWRRDEPTTMDPKLFDILWEVYREVGGKEPIEIISAYRSPGTNAMLRTRSSGVAENSNHTTGHAIDFEIPGVPLARIREVGLRLQRGGVGFYPTSGSPFVHLDTGSIRHWPRMTREQLVKVFPDERTVHIPSDGQPLAGYALALADVQSRGNAPSNVLMAQAREAGITEARSDTAKKPRSLLAALFTRSATADELSDEAQAAEPTPAKVTLASASAKPDVKPKPVATATIVPLPSSRPRPIAVAAADPAPAAANVIAPPGGALWANAVESGDLAPKVAQSPFTFADTMTTASTNVLAYAAEPARVATQLPPPRPAKAPPMGANIPVAPPAAMIAAAPAGTSAAQVVAPAIAGGGGRTDSPWLRAAILTPDLASFMTATHMGARDMSQFGHLFHKPAQAVMMSFSADPGLGLVAGRFTGSAVTFLATATFVPQTTASLR